MSVKNLIFIIPLILLTLMGCKKNTAQPNVVFILADDLGYGDLSSYGATKVQTPHIDELAENGIRFTDAHSPSAICTPTRYTFLTGRYSWRTKLKQGIVLPWDSPLIEENRMTLGNLFLENGYNTAAIGKWHLGWHWAVKNNGNITDSLVVLGKNMQKRAEFSKSIDFTKPITGGPIDKGFQYHFGDDVPNFPPYTFIENDRVTKIPTIMKPNSIYGNPGIMADDWDLTKVMPEIQQHGVDYINNSDKKFKRENGKPFFLYLPLTAPHTPIAPTKEFIGSSNAGRYGDYIQQIDHLVGEVVDALKVTGDYENTIIIFSSDNGSPARNGENMSGAVNSVVNEYGHHANGNLRGYKSAIFEGGHRVPLIIQWPKQIKQSLVSNRTVSLIDFMATFASMLNFSLPVNAGEDSESFINFESKKASDFILPNNEPHVFQSGNGVLCIRSGKWKLIDGGGSGGWIKPRTNQDAEKEGLPLIQLYNLEDDLQESNNVYKQHPEIVTDLMEQLNHIRNK